MHNFLSEDIDKFRSSVRVRFANACDRFEKLSTIAAGQFAELTFDGKSPAERVAIVYWSKCVRGCQAAFLLAERGMVADAQSTLRGAVETLFHSVALVRKPEILTRLDEHDRAEKKKQVVQMFKHTGVDGALTNADRELLRPISEMSGGSPFSVWEAADAANMGHLYEVLYRTLSQTAAHSTLTSLNHELLSKVQAEPVLRFGPVEDHLEWTVNLISDCLDAGIYVMQALCVSRK